MSGISRRSVLRAGTGVVVASSFSRLWARESAVPGTLTPVADSATGLPLLKLPKGFTYRSFSWSGDAMADGATNASKDTMAWPPFRPPGMA